MEKNVTTLQKGLHTDSSPQAQPKGTYSYALNSINETELGDSFFNSNEESNEICGELPDDHVALGKVYVGNGDTVIFSLLDNNTSEIGIISADCSYDPLVQSDLGFRSLHQIDATFRLRRGCERTIYWVDGINKPRYLNLDRTSNFKNDNGEWDINKFNLIRNYEKIPNLEKIEVKNGGGQLNPGSYNIGIQYLDENLNPTEWITTSEIISIYNDSTNDDYLDINGSINKSEDYRNFPVTGKSIEVTVSNLDESFTFYRLAFIEASDGDGFVSHIKYTSKIPILQKVFVYTGVNFESKGTEEEILQVNNIIDSADSIEQVENRLLLANVKGKKINFCEFQKHASKITADLILEKRYINVLLGSTKDPTARIDGIGYMPGEIYSFGIVYVFNDGSLSPVYHIPGRSPETLESHVFDPVEGAMPMSIDNSSLSIYTDNENCIDDGYWGVDNNNVPLKNKQIRHHRFPLRSEINKKICVKEEGEISYSDNFVQFKLIISFDTYELCGGDPCIELEDLPIVTLKTTINFSHNENDNERIIDFNIKPKNYSTYEISKSDTIALYSDFFKIENVNNIKDIKDINNSITYQVEVKGENSDKLKNLKTVPSEGCTGLCEGVTVISANSSKSKPIYSTEIFGIHFSNIDISELKNVKGYYIVRNERTENEKTILDSGVLVPCRIHEKYISNGILGSEYNNLDDYSGKFSETTFGIIHPEHKFNGKEYPTFTSLQHEGTFNIEERITNRFKYQDVYDGSSYNGKYHKTEDEDGWSLKAITRDNILRFVSKDSTALTADKPRYTDVNAFNFDFNDDIDQVFYLNALQSKDVDNNQKSIYNIAGDNKIGIVHLKSNWQEDIKSSFPYVYIKRKLIDPYSNFRILPYIKCSNNVEAKNSTSVFGGDNYVSPMRYVNTIFWDNREAKRGLKTSWTRIVGGILMIATGAIAIIATAGAAAPGVISVLASTLIVSSSVSIIGGGILLANSGIKIEAWNNVYFHEYKKGLRKTVFDDWVSSEYHEDVDTVDDEIQWIGECATNFFFDSQINIPLRYKLTSEVSSFLDAPYGREEEPKINDIWKDDSIYPITKLDRHIAEKLLGFDPERFDSKIYLGHCLGEFYEVNPDYQRLNVQKLFFHLALEYDCCSSCQEIFPHRVHYSEQSFQEELSDNFRVFLANNYRDIEGETGVITDLFRIKENLYIHTQEALWHLPQNHQERITNDIVSFIGTGDFFSVPPRKILDGKIPSGGCEHKWATVNTKYGVFFVSEKERRIFRFNGNELKAISDIGNSNWFKENIGFNLEYDSINAPSDINGVGFVSVYDVRKERILFTKKDFGPNGIDLGWTMSFSLKSNSWISFHSYCPYFYFNSGDSFISMVIGNNSLWKHNKIGNYQNYYGTGYPYIIEYVSLPDPLKTKIWDEITLQTEAKRYIPEKGQYKDENNITFNKAILYNTNQCTGELDLKVKEKNTSNYMRDQVYNNNLNTILINRNERDWVFNNIRDLRVDYNQPIFDSHNKPFSKIINDAGINHQKPWNELQSLRDKYLVIRLIFDNFNDVKLIMNFSIEENINSNK